MTDTQMILEGPKFFSGSVEIESYLKKCQVGTKLGLFRSYGCKGTSDVKAEKKLKQNK